MLRKGNDGKAAHGVFEEDAGMNEDRMRSPTTRRRPTGRSADDRRRRSRKASPARARHGWRGAVRLGVLLLLLAALGYRRLAALSACSAQVMATAEQQPRFRPERARRAGARRAARSMSVSCPATTAAFDAANIFARASGYIAQARGRYRRPRQGRGNCWSRSRRPSSIIRSRRPRRRWRRLQALAAAGRGQSRTREGHLGPRQPLVQEGLGHRRSRATPID